MRQQRTPKRYVQSDWANGGAPSPGFLRCARNPTSPRTRGEVEFAAIWSTIRHLRSHSGLELTTPLERYPRLKAATAEQRANYEAMPMGIHWPDLDEDLGIAGMPKGRT
ncbi:MAG TPA: DUF2442 domain-containing protein [Xanthobacteraceae bacterium]|nr:DUF2442 domain-containing protein [Xanthobacteraceae bacterium]